MTDVTADVAGIDASDRQASPPPRNSSASSSSSDDSAVGSRNSDDPARPSNGSDVGIDDDAIDAALLLDGVGASEAVTSRLDDQEEDPDVDGETACGCAISEAALATDLPDGIIDLGSQGGDPDMTNLSFAGCGFLGIYHLGVASTMVKHGPKFFRTVDRFAGASAGALVAGTLAVKGADVETLQKCTDFCFDLANTIRNKKFGVLNPKGSLLEPLEAFIQSIMPEDCHEVASGRLYVSVSVPKGSKRKNHLVSQFSSKDELIKYLLGSSYIPKLTGKKAVVLDGQKLLDGGLTVNQPVLPEGRTILVSPFCGKQDICPVDKRGLGWFTSIKHQEFQINGKNMRRGVHALFPPKHKALARYFQKGQLDAIRFLEREGMYEEAPDDAGVQIPEEVKKPSKQESKKKSKEKKEEKEKEKERKRIEPEHVSR